jgi:flagellar export protein FliJ
MGRMSDRSRVVVRVRKIAEDRASAAVGMAHADLLAASTRADEAAERCHVHPVAASGTGVTGAALASAAGQSAALLANARTAAEMVLRADQILADARVQAGAARAARLAAERLAERREAMAALDAARADQRQTDEMVSARHGRHGA